MCRHYLFFQAVTSQVSSARVSLTAVFGMGTGGPSPQSAPTSSTWTSYPSLRPPTKAHSLRHVSSPNQIHFAGFRFGFKGTLFSVSLLFQLLSQLKPIQLNGDPWESRTPVCGVRGRRLDHLTNGPSSSQAPHHSLPPLAKAHSLRYSSSSNRTRFAGLRLESLPLSLGLPLGCLTPKREWYTFRDSNPGHPD